MANVDIRVGKKNAAFFAANPTLILKDGQFIFNSDTSELFIGDGTTQLSALVAINGGSSYVLTDAEIGSVINAATTATPNDTDLVISVDASVAKKNTWTQIKTFLKTYFDTIYTTTAAVASQITTALSGLNVVNLIRQEFTYTTGPQTFTLSNSASAVYAVFVNGQELRQSQYTVVTTTLTIIDTLEANDRVDVIYSNATLGINPSYTKSESDTNFEPKNSNIQTHISNTSNPHSVTKTQVGLSNVPNVDTTTTANITDSTNKRFVTDAQLTVIGNTSGTNSGDVSVTDGTTIDFTLTGQALTAEVKDNSITEAKQLLADNTTNDVSTTKHGYAPKLPNDATKFLDGTGAYSVPAGGGGGSSATSNLFAYYNFI